MRRIPLVHFAFGAALLASYVNQQGETGAIIGAIVLSVWGLIFYSKNRQRAFWFTICIIVFFSITSVCFLVGKADHRDASTRSTCKNNLKQIGLALHDYHHAYDSFPPAYVMDEDGRPLYSWRVLLLPYLDNQELYDAFHLDEPWDSEWNKQFLKQMPMCYACPSHHRYDEKPEMTSYAAVIGEHTAWPAPKASHMRDIKDGLTYTVMVIEHQAETVPWTSPQDPTLQEAIESLSSTDIENFGGHRYEYDDYDDFRGRSILFGDGSVDWAPFGLNREVAAHLLTRDDGQVDSDMDLSKAGAGSARRIHWQNVILFWIFVVLNVLPLPFVFRIRP